MSEKAIELNREFVVLSSGDRIHSDDELTYARFAGKPLLWTDLRDRRRVVVLAEANSGKSTEFELQVQQLRGDGERAYLLEIANLAQNDLAACLSLADERAVLEWRDSPGSGPAWFFLDALDEAKLQHCSLQQALRNLARGLGDATARAHVVISSRVSDWQESDRADIEKWLSPLPRSKATPGDGTTDVIGSSSDPLFKKDSQEISRRAERLEAERKLDELLVVRLLPLDEKQVRAIASTIGVTNVDAFMAAVNEKALEIFTERPGDVIAMVQSWQTSGKLTSLVEMMEEGTNWRLKELHPNRPDNREVSLSELRNGAERLAAAMTLAGTFVLRGTDRSGAAAEENFLDPRDVLPDWTEGRIETLRRRGIFSPETYGRIRFHDRRTQEYLTACWLRSCFEQGKDARATWRLIFVEPHGVKTVVPSMRASAAWLALWNKQVRDELVRREPLLLIRNGDPASLQVDAKKALLKQIGEKPQLGREARTYIEQRLIVMFADPVLSDDVHVAWAKATDEEIQSLLLNIVASGRIANGAMIGQAALHGEWNVRVQVDAVESLLGCGDTSTLQHFANQFYAQLPQYSSHAIGAITARLFPEYLSPAQLVTALQDTDANETWNLQDYWFRCRNDDERESLMNALADSCLTPPVDKHYGINKERKELARRCARMLRKIYQRDGTLHNSKGLRRLLVVVARVRIEYGDEENLQSMIQADRGLKRDVFWEHVQVVRETREEPEKELDRLSFFYNQQFWSFDQDDVPWLLDELTTRTSADDRQVLLRAIWTTLAPRNEFAAAEKDVRAIIHDDASLQAQLNDYLRPPSPDTEREIEEHRQEMERHQQRMRSKKKAQQQQLTEFRDRLVADPGLLTRDISEGGDGESMRLLLRLDEWFTQAADEDWQQFRDAFGADVVDAYREGMRLHWITTPPRAPVRTGSGTRNVFWSQVLANRALDMEAKSTPGWAATLTTAEARRAAEHVCIGAGTHPEWFPKLLAAHSKEVAAPLEDMIENDWRTSQIDREGFLTHYAWTSEELPDFLQQLLVDTMLQIPPHTSDQLHQCASLIPRCQSVSNLTQLLPLLEEVLGGININDANDLQRGAYCLAAISRLDVDQAISTLLEWLHGLANAGTNELAIGLLASLFSRMRNGPTIYLENADLSLHRTLLETVYQVVDPRDDEHVIGCGTPTPRFDAEQARNVVLSAFVNRPGSAIYRALNEIAESLAALPDRHRRFQELAYEHAEREAQGPPWSAQDFNKFQARQIAPLDSSSLLLDYALDRLAGIQDRMNTADFSTRGLISGAKDEKEVQHWLAEQLDLYSRGAYDVTREKEVVNRKEPDITLTARPGVELAIEIKQGNRVKLSEKKPAKIRWSVNALETAFRDQLAELYLLPESRRAGVLVVTHHDKTRRWEYPGTSKSMEFSEVVDYLREVAATLHSNSAGNIRVAVFGIDIS